ncbi:DedA family protein [Cellulomonas bogoriensis]|uniref:VTT domain-containing protein n=1 Tax=Cellulomonas bogoriensis 69B4 = DSM 16987 TaxID=1386082 RepID=A0A0A0C2W8_9CELL|nr:DedA family protein [Cellulomonas bogoriensis]KGM14526.1 hypothetical protein N869_05125 [Cellulomonas bogoriensis 69B4 = DSM 16987]
MVEEWVITLAGSPWVFVALYAFAVIDGIFPPVPSESVVIALAALSVAGGEPNLWLLVAVAALGAFTGDQIAYQTGRHIPVRRLRVMSSRRAQRTLDWAERALTQRGAALILGARYIPVGRVAVNLTAGTVAYPRRRFVGLAGLAAVTWAGYSTLLGVGAGVWLKEHPLVAVGVGVAGGITIGLVVDAVLRRVLERRRAAAPAGAVAGGQVPHQGAPVPERQQVP